eukprot:TRINITY_DN16550_c0_g1_i1.p1 TRINITY_DN16550_c0_g1~~TRINITY_DN16550_c0_g1_i1.p1  ORF type:complete len:436 (-),score=75.28 TRINITY_DN16550_c0_g1_i1:29-1336(-)
MTTQGTDAEKGRILLAAKPFSQGEIVFSEEPLLLVENPPPFLAARDLRELEALCEQANFPDLQPYLFHSVLAYDRLENPGKEAAVLAMCRPPKDSAAPGLLSALRTVLRELVKRNMLRRNQPKQARHASQRYTIEDLLDVLLSFGANAFELGENGGGVLYERASLLSHSCRPNCAWAQDGVRYVLRVVDPNGVQAGVELTVSYLHRDLFTSTAMRRERLSATSFFFCRCERCLAQPDRSRMIPCRATPECVGFFPLPSRGDAETEGECLQCSRRTELSATELSAILAWEESAASVLDGARDEPFSVELFDEVICQQLLPMARDLRLAPGGHWALAALHEKISEFWQLRGNSLHAAQHRAQQLRFLQFAMPGLPSAQLAECYGAISDLLSMQTPLVRLAPGPKPKGKCCSAADWTLKPAQQREFEAEYAALEKLFP